MTTYKTLIETCLSIGKNPRKAVKYLHENGFDLDLNAYVAMRELHNQRQKNRPWCGGIFGGADLELRLSVFKMKREQVRQFARFKKMEAVREDLLRSARVARKLGYKVDSSEYNGKISSYYIWIGQRKFRVSDHDIPENQRRIEMGTKLHADIYASAGKHRRAQWWIRAFCLLANGRSVPMA